MKRHLPALMLALALVTSACSTGNERSDDVKALNDRISVLEGELYVATSTTIAVTTTNPPDTTTTTLQPVTGVRMGDYFALPGITSSLFDEAGIPSLVAWGGALSYLSALDEGTDCDAVSQASMSTAGTYGEWALGPWYETVLVWGEATVIQSFERCLDPNDIPTGWWYDHWQQAQSTVG